MPTTLLTCRRTRRGLPLCWPWLSLALLAVAPTALSLAACVDLRPRSERGDAGMEPGDGGVDAGRDTGVDSGLDAGPVEDLGTCAQDSACTCTPAVTAVGLSVVAHGAQLSVTGACLTGVTTVRVGGVTQGFVVNDDGRLTIASVADTTPVGLSQPLVAMSPQGSSTARNVTVAHLVVNEVDTATDMGGMQRSQFVEIDTGLAASVNLAEYMVVFFTGADDGVYDTTRGAPLGTTAASGLYLLAGSSVSGAQATLPNSTLASTTDAHAVVLYQGTVLPPSTETLAGLTLPMIDALVYSRIATTSDAGLLDVCYPDALDRVQQDEGSNGGNPLTQSIRRCSSKRRAGTSFGVAAPTPGAANGCP